MLTGKKIAIIGGAGFIGSNAASTWQQAGNQLIVFDNLSRKGTSENLQWLQENHKVDFYEGDIRRYEELEKFFQLHSDIEVVAHLAAQVAVTTSVTNPREDFEINALGTFNVLEALRNHCPDAILLFASTNKVYGGMEDIVIEEQGGRYVYRDLPTGIPETSQLDFHSPYGCSKGAGDQYVRDYARIYGLKTVVLRQSCIYGYRQFGVEDQGWVAWFIIAAVLGKPLSIYGDGKQVRDVLFVDDLIAAYSAAVEQIETTAGQCYNVGGGPKFTLAVWSEFGPLLEELLGRKLPITFGDWRPGDQKVYVSQIDKAERDFQWQPTVAPQEGITRLYHWVEENRELFQRLFP